MELFAKRPRQAATEVSAETKRTLYRLYLGKLLALTDYSLLAMRAAAKYSAAARLFDELSRVKLAHASQLGQLLLRYGVSPTPRLTPQREWQQLQSFCEESERELQNTLTAHAKKERSTAKDERNAAKEPGTATALPLARILTAMATEDEEHAAVIDGLLLRMQHS